MKKLRTVVFLLGAVAVALAAASEPAEAGWTKIWTCKEVGGQHSIINASGDTWAGGLHGYQSNDCAVHDDYEPGPE